MIQKLISTGIYPELSFGLQNKIRIFNTSLLVIFLVNLFYIIVGLFNPLFYPNLLSFSYATVLVVIFLLIRSGKQILAFHGMMTFSILFLITISILFGEISEVHVFLLFAPLASIVLFDEKKCIFNYFLFAMAAMCGVKLLYPHYEVPYPDAPAKHFGALNLLFTGILLYLGIMRFKTENSQFTDEIKLQRKLLEEKNKDITDSIQYAKRIQKALMASDTLLNKNLPEHFVLYKPKAIVSGDFYWGEKIDNKFLLATCDCTGHGVPGAFMSLLGVSFLNEITKEKNITQPDLVFNSLRANIINALNPEWTEEEGKDGMDAVLCNFDFQKMEMELACANNPLWILRNNQWLIFKSDKFPIGMQGEIKPFTLQKLQLQKDDLIYTFTDGYADQFGGEKGKKFKYKNIQQLLLNNSSKSMSEQKKIMDDTIEKWKGNLEQVDDILIIGIRI